MLVIKPTILNRMVVGTKSSMETCFGFFFGHENDEHTISKSMAVMNASEGDESGNFEITSQHYLYAEQPDIIRCLSLPPQSGGATSEHSRKTIL